MRLLILFANGRGESLPVQRTAVIRTNNCSGFSAGTPKEMLYYECPGQRRGHGRKLPMSDIKHWEVNE